MNPLSSFSFGQLIKTFLPGLIATACPLLVLETWYEWNNPCPPTFQELLRQAFTATFLGPNLAGSLTLLALLALLLGFSLNSVHWSLFHNLCRDRCTPKQLKEAQKELEKLAEEALERVLKGNYTFDAKFKPSIQGYFLPQIDLAKLTFLRESYFAWYEFHMNSLVALGMVSITLVTTSLALTAHWELGWRGEAALLVLVTTASAAAAFFLLWAAFRNLKEYETRSFWFLIGTLHNLPEGKLKAPESKTAPG